MGFSRQEYWSGLLFLSPRDLSDPGIRIWVSCTAGGFFIIWATKEALISYTSIQNKKPKEKSHASIWPYNQDSLLTLLGVPHAKGLCHLPIESFSDLPNLNQPPGSLISPCSYNAVTSKESGKGHYSLCTKLCSLPIHMLKPQVPRIWLYWCVSPSVMSDSLRPPWTWTVAHKAPLSIEFSRQESWSGLPFPWWEYLQKEVI